MYPTHVGPIGCFMLILWSHKYKLGHIDLILMTPHSPEKPEYSYVSHTPPLKKHVKNHAFRTFNLDNSVLGTSKSMVNNT